MWYRCEELGQSNQVYQLQLLQNVTRMKNCDFCEDKSKSKNEIVYYKSCTSTKSSYFSVFLSRIMQNYGKGWTREQHIDSYEEISLLGKICCFYQKRKRTFEKF